MTNIKIEIKKGKELTKKQLDTINFFRKKEFGSKKPIAPSQDNEDWNKEYFMLCDENENLLAFGRLHEIEVEVTGKKHNILGIATIISALKGKGYGKILMLGMKEYILGTGKTAIGFCNSSISEFYKKAGYTILPSSGERFLYRDSYNNLIPSKYGNDDVIALEGKDKLIETITSNPNAIVYMGRKHW